MDSTNLMGRPNSMAFSLIAEADAGHAPPIPPIRFWSRSPEWHRLSAFAPDPFEDGFGNVWPTLEAWYQAGKSSLPEYREALRLTTTGPQAKGLGRSAPSTANEQEDWIRRGRRMTRMAEGLLFKYKPGSGVAQDLFLSTGPSRLIHATPWGRNGDPFWGEGRRGNGQDVFGRMLTTVKNHLAVGEPLGSAEELVSNALAIPV